MGQSNTHLTSNVLAALVLEDRGVSSFVRALGLEASCYRRLLYLLIRARWR